MTCCSDGLGHLVSAVCANLFLASRLGAGSFFGSRPITIAMGCLGNCPLGAFLDCVADRAVDGLGALFLAGCFLIYRVFCLPIMARCGDGLGDLVPAVGADLLPASCLGAGGFFGSRPITIVVGCLGNRPLGAFLDCVADGAVDGLGALFLAGCLLVYRVFCLPLVACCGDGLGHLVSTGCADLFPAACLGAGRLFGSCPVSVAMACCGNGLGHLVSADRADFFPAAGFCAGGLFGSCPVSVTVCCLGDRSFGAFLDLTADGAVDGLNALL